MQYFRHSFHLIIVCTIIFTRIYFWIYLPQMFTVPQNLFHKMSFLRGELCLLNRFIWWTHPNEIYFYPDISTSGSNLKANIYFIVFTSLVFLFFLPSMSFAHKRTVGWIKRLNRRNKIRSTEAKVAVRRIRYFRGFQQLYRLQHCALSDGVCLLTPFDKPLRLFTELLCMLVSLASESTAVLISP